MAEAVHLALEVKGCELTYAKEVAKAILHTILFHRCFGQIVPRTQEILDLTLSQVDDEALEAIVDERASDFARALRTSSSVSNTTPGQDKALVIQFYEKKVRKAWFSRAEEEVCWESWTLTLVLIPPSRNEIEKKENLSALGRELNAAVIQILTIVNERNDEYVPPIPYGDGNPFPYQISIR